MELSELLGDAYRDGMTLEEVSAALKGVEMPKDNSAEIGRLKNALSKSNADAADWKRKYQDTLDDAGRKAADEAEATKQLQEELNRMKREMTVSGYKASYVGMGYSESEAAKIAESLADGKIDDVLARQKAHQEKLTEQIKKDLLKGTPRPDGSQDDKDDDSDAMKRAREMAKARAESSRRASEAMKNYLR